MGIRKPANIQKYIFPKKRQHFQSNSKKLCQIFKTIRLLYRTRTWSDPDDFQEVKPNSQMADSDMGADFEYGQV